MLRILRILAACCIVTGSCLKLSAAQPTAGNNAPAALAQLLGNNPLIHEVARQDPDGLLNLLSKLQFVMTNHGAPARAGSPPTEAEAAQIVANPAFSQAYKNDAAGTLVLLREANEALQNSRQGADLDQPRRLALVVGDGGDETWGRLANTTRDAELVARTLKSLGFELVTGGALIDPDQTTLRRAIKDFGHSIGSRTVALFYFAGHGIQFGGHNYLVPLGADLPQSEEDYDRNLVAVDATVLRQMQEAAGRLNIVVLDACRDHPPPRTPLTVASRGASQKGLAVVATPPGMKGTVIIYSTAPNDVARDRANDNDVNSPFAKAFADTIVKPGMEMRDAFEEVFEGVGQATNGAQQPWIEYSAVGKFSFAEPAVLRQEPPRSVLPATLTPGQPDLAPPREKLPQTTAPGETASPANPSAPTSAPSPVAPGTHNPRRTPQEARPPAQLERSAQAAPAIHPPVMRAPPQPLPAPSAPASPSSRCKTYGSMSFCE